MCFFVSTEGKCMAKKLSSGYEWIPEVCQMKHTSFSNDFKLTNIKIILKLNRIVHRYIFV